MDPYLTTNQNLDDLYDLAGLLTGDEDDAERLVLSTLRSRSSRKTAGGEPSCRSRELMVQRYLHKFHRPASRTRDSARRYCANREPPESPWPTVVEKALGRLTAEERTCLILRERLGLAATEIARATGLGPERTRQALFAARERLMSSISEAASDERTVRVAPDAD